jgi:hypothetical protein
MTRRLQVLHVPVHRFNCGRPQARLMLNAGPDREPGRPKAVAGMQEGRSGARPHPAPPAMGIARHAGSGRLRALASDGYRPPVSRLAAASVGWVERALRAIPITFCRRCDGYRPLRGLHPSYASRPDGTPTRPRRPALLPLTPRRSNGSGGPRPAPRRAPSAAAP